MGFRLKFNKCQFISIWLWGFFRCFRGKYFLFCLICKTTVILLTKVHCVCSCDCFAACSVFFGIQMTRVSCVFSFCWLHLSAAAGGWCVSSSMWFFCQSRQCKSLILHFPASKSSLQASVLSHLDNPSPPSFPLWDERSLMRDKSLDF